MFWPDTLTELKLHFIFWNDLSLCPWIICSLKVSRWFLLTRVSLLNGSRNRCRLMWFYRELVLIACSYHHNCLKRTNAGCWKCFWLLGFSDAMVLLKCFDSFERNQWIKKWPCNKSFSSFYCYNPAYKSIKLIRLVLLLKILYMWTTSPQPGEIWFVIYTEDRWVSIICS